MATGRSSFLSILSDRVPGSQDAFKALVKRYSYREAERVFTEAFRIPLRAKRPRYEKARDTLNLRMPPEGAKLGTLKRWRLQFRTTKKEFYIVLDFRGVEEPAISFRRASDRSRKRISNPVEVFPKPSGVGEYRINRHTGPNRPSFAELLRIVKSGVTGGKVIRPVNAKALIFRPLNAYDPRTKRKISVDRFEGDVFSKDDGVVTRYVIQGRVAPNPAMDSAFRQMRRLAKEHVEEAMQIVQDVLTYKREI